MNVDKRVLEYIRLRDKMKEMKQKHEEELAPYVEAQEALSKLLLSYLTRANTESMRTAHGTLYKKSHKSASIVDKELFWNFIVEGQLWDLVDKRANATACADYAEEHKAFPPGLNYTDFITAGVRKS